MCHKSERGGEKEERKVRRNHFLDTNNGAFLLSHTVNVIDRQDWYDLLPSSHFNIALLLLAKAASIYLNDNLTGS